MNNKKKQSVAVAMATAIGVSAMMSPVAIIHAQEEEPPTAITQETAVNSTQENDSSIQEKEKGDSALLIDTEYKNEIDTMRSSIEKNTDDAFTDLVVAEKAIEDAINSYDFSNETTQQELQDFLNQQFVNTGKLKEIPIWGYNVSPNATTTDKGRGAFNFEFALTNDSFSKKFTYVFSIPRLPKEGEVAINSKNFPDPIFNKYVKDKFDTDKDDVLSVDDIKDIVSIDLSLLDDGIKIESLQGIEYFTELKNLNCYGSGGAATSLKSLNVSKNTKLEILNCSANANLTSLNVNGATALTQLDCNSTGITALDVSENIALTLLYCNNTGIENLDVSNNNTLEWLDCSETPLAYLNIGDNTGLTVDKGNLKNPTIDVTTDTFMFRDIFSGIDITKISNLKGADWNATTGEVSYYTFGTPITYTYACGTSKGGEETLTVELTVTNELAIDETNFPDKAFRDWLKAQPYGTDETIDKTEIAGITVINVVWCTNIKDLTGIEHFTALTDLNCLGTGIESLNISKNMALEYLVCGDRIESLDVSNNTALAVLQCSFTGITSLDISNNTALIELSCHNTGIESLDISKNTALTDLYCSDTGITSLDVSNNTALEYLDYSDTGITSLDVSNNTALEYLDCSDTGITSLDVSNNTALTNLDCSDTPLAYLNIGTNNNLTTLIKDNLKPVNVEVTDSFKIADIFAGIDTSKISNVTGATYSNGAMSNYIIGKPITYTYACGTSSGGKEQTIDVTLNLIGKSTISITEDLNKAYNGNAVSATPIVERAGSTGVVSYKWEQNNNNNWEVIASAPTDAGTYRVTATLSPDDDYPEAISEPVEFTISQATNSWIDTLSITGWTYGETANKPTAIAMFGKASYLYSDSENGTYTDAVPINAGTWYVKASVAGTDNYTRLESIKKFEIAKATDTWVEKPTILDWVFNETANTPTAKAKSGGTVVFTYSSSEKGTYTDKVPTNAGTWYLKASVADSNNYKGLNSIISFTIAPKNIKESQITVSDINNDKDVDNLVVKDGDKELKKGTDYDVDKKQEGNEVTVTISFKGNYTGVITKTYTVAIETPKEEPKKTENIQTGDHTQTGLLATISLLSAGCIAFLTGKKRKKYNR